MGVSTLRRYYHLKAKAAIRLQETALAATFTAKQKNLPGTPLPLAFPSRTRLVAGGYSTFEDITDITNKELQQLGIVGRALTAVTEARDTSLGLRGDNKTPLPAGFPEREWLITLGYTTTESLTEFDLLEIAKLDGITDEVMTAIREALEPPTT
jgi:hypothetical protein